MARVVITGASGLLGHAVAAEFLTQGWRVHCLGRTPPDIDHPALDFTACDLRWSIDSSALPKTADALVHLAQCERFNEFPEGADEVFAVNVAAYAALLDWARRAGIGVTCSASTGGLYAGGHEPLTETSPIKLDGRLAFYVTTKRAAELLGEAYQTYFTVCALRFFFIYGSRQRPHMLFRRLIASVCEGRALTLQGADGMRMNPVHVDDAARATVAAVIRKASGVFNVAGPEIVSLRDIGEAIGERLGVRPDYNVLADQAPNDLIGDIGRMSSVLVAPCTGLRQGLAEMCR
jgi:UDP-glucose 4-epimerase